MLETFQSSSWLNLRLNIEQRLMKIAGQLKVILIHVHARRHGKIKHPLMPFFYKSHIRKYDKHLLQHRGIGTFMF